MNLTRNLAVVSAMMLTSAARIESQVIERPVPFDVNGRVMVMTPYIAERAALRAPWWPVAGEFTEARMFTTNDSTYVLAVGRRSGVVERYTISVADRDAIRAIVSRLPSDVIAARTDARNSFVRNQTILGFAVYGPAFAGAIGDNDAGQVAGYLVVAGGSFFAASEISRRTLITRPQSDLAFNMGHNFALAGWATAFLFKGRGRAQSAGALVGGLFGSGLGLGLGRGMTAADAVGAGFGSDLGALIGAGVSTAIRGEGSVCVVSFDSNDSCAADRAQVATILASGLIGYPMGLLYPRNARYHVTPGDINTLWSGAMVGAATGGALLHESPSRRAVATALTSGGLLGVIIADRFLVQRADHGRTEATQLLFGTGAGWLMGLGVGALGTNAHRHPQRLFAFGAVGSLAGIIATEYYLNPSPDAGRPRISVSFNTAGLAATAMRTPGNHPIFEVRF
ncbi:MAG TPA: hypothetical protein VJ865_03550 [Gemmatimonadaceae bacterium]|nr:hypothetical protein [Gemmatimonadaceae bacterium]